MHSGTLKRLIASLVLFAVLLCCLVYDLKIGFSSSTNLLNDYGMDLSTHWLLVY